MPIAVKDIFCTEGIPTTAGSRILEGYVPPYTATAVASLGHAGARVLGKTNMHEIGILPNGLNTHNGPVRNPYGPAHEAGGSSSGSAAAVAAGLCAAAIGADGGGSIRIPAAYCGVIGLKPTYGRVSEFGAVPLAQSVAHLGPIAATADRSAPRSGRVPLTRPDRRENVKEHLLVQQAFPSLFEPANGRPGQLRAWRRR